MDSLRKEIAFVSFVYAYPLPKFILFTQKLIVKIQFTLELLIIHGQHYKL